jgi:D-hydroxyproline dehydrogenase subunit beta
VSRGGAPDVAVVGAGIIGAACALLLARSGARVELFERAFPAAGSTGAGEGNVLAWDKELQRELPLALRSAVLWEELADGLSPDIEYDRKGSIVVAETEPELAAATERAEVLAHHGVRGSPLSADDLRSEEPMSAPDLPGGVLYPDDAQVEPRLAATALVRRAAACGARVSMGVSVDAIERDRSGRAVALATAQGSVPVGAVVVAAGAWTAALLERCGLSVPIRPRKGQILVLERSATPVRRKLSEAGYVSAVESGEERLQVAMVVESTRSGTTLIGSSRELVGFDRDVDIDVAAAVARRAIRFYPPLAGLSVIRTYAGLRPFSPDHLPVIGPFPEAENVCVATGHEGAGIGLGPATGELVAAWHAGGPPPPGLSLHWFSPARFAEVAAE